MAGFFPNYQGCVYWHTSAPMCSGNGYCVSSLNNTEIIHTPFLPNTKCICNKYWNGHGLFISQNNQDCSNYYPWIMTNAGLNCLLELLFIYLQLKKIYEIVREHKRLRAMRPGGNHSILKDRPVLAFILLNIPWDVANFVMCMLIIFDHYPGDSFLATLPYILSILSANLSGLYYQKMVIGLSVSMVHVSQDHRKRLNLAQKPKCFGKPQAYLPILVLILISFVLIGFFSNNMLIQHVLVFVPYTFSVLSTFTGGYETMVLLNVVIEVLGESRFTTFAQEGRRHEAITRIKELKGVIVSSWTMGAFVIFGLPILWPYFRTRQMYVWLLAIPLTSSSSIQKAMSFSSTGKTWNANDSLDLFLYLVDKKFEEFLAFLKTEYSGENLLFWRRVEDYRTVSDPEAEIAKQIFLEYISPDSPQAINISSTHMTELQEWYQRATSPDPSVSVSAIDHDTLKTLFFPAQREIFQLMCNDSLPRFRHTPECQAAIKAFESQVFFESNSKNKDFKTQMVELSSKHDGNSKHGTIGSKQDIGSKHDTNDPIGISGPSLPPNSSRRSSHNHNRMNSLEDNLVYHVNVMSNALGSSEHDLGISGYSQPPSPGDTPRTRPPSPKSTADNGCSSPSRTTSPDHRPLDGSGAKEDEHADVNERDLLLTQEKSVVENV